jgi:hypothetical protein
MRGMPHQSGLSCSEMVALARQLQELRIQFHQVCFKTVVAAAPFRVGLRGGETQDREIPFMAILARNLGKILPYVGGRATRDQLLAVGLRYYGAQHALILCVGLAEIEVRHGTVIIGGNAVNFNGTSGPRCA